MLYLQLLGYIITFIMMFYFKVIKNLVYRQSSCRSIPQSDLRDFSMERSATKRERKAEKLPK
jgi:hypothetical protein